MRATASHERNSTEARSASGFHSRLRSLGEGLGEGGGVFGGDEIAILAVGEQLGDSADAGGDDGLARGQGFEDDVGAALVAAGEAEDVDSAHPARDGVVGLAAEEAHAVAEAQGGDAGAHLSFDLARADDPELGVAIAEVRREVIHGLDQDVGAFDGADVADIANHRAIVLDTHALAGLGARAELEAGAVDAVVLDEDALARGAEIDDAIGDGAADGEDALRALEAPADLRAQAKEVGNSLTSLPRTAVTSGTPASRARSEAATASG